jgi:hypothetical protein
MTGRRGGRLIAVDGGVRGRAIRFESGPYLGGRHRDERDRPGVVAGARPGVDAEASR